MTYPTTIDTFTTKVNGVTDVLAEDINLIQTAVVSLENAVGLDSTNAGAIAHFAKNVAPTGWLKANGAAISRTTYAILFGQIGTTFGVGDGTTTFNLPDLRGEFLRGFDDGRGVDSGRVFGSAQDQQARAVATFQIAEYTDGGSGERTIPQDGSYSSYARTGELGSANRHSIRMKTNTVETRPRNIALLACIKY